MPLTLTGEWRELLPSLAPLREAIRSAQRLYFAPGASAAAHDLSADRASLERARAQIFAPFEQVWIEMAEIPDIGALWQSEPGHAQDGRLIVLTWPRSHPVPVV